ncbi:MAG: hypothetical protein AAF726_03565 [Planctomycetota bacterium]
MKITNEPCRTASGRGVRRLAPLLALSFLVAGCPDDDDPVSQNRLPTVAVFAPSTGAIPLPSDLLFSESVDGTLNAPIADPDNTADPTIALNTLDGHSTVAPIVVEFSRAIDPSTVVGGDSVRVYEVSDFTAPPNVIVGGPVTAVDRELTAGSEYEIVVFSDPLSNGGARGSIQISPLVPLTPSVVGDNGVYMVVVTNDVRDSQGFRVQQDTEYVFASVEEPYVPPVPDDLIQLQGLVDAQLNALQTFAGIERPSVAVSFTFTTQSVGDVLDTVFLIANGQESAVISGLCGQLGTCGTDTMPNPFSTPALRLAPMGANIGTASELVGGPPGLADVWVGILDAPYYLTAAQNNTFDGVTNDTAPITTTWEARYPSNPFDEDQHPTRFNPLPNATASESLPALICVPNTGSVPMNGWPIVLFAHGVGQSRTNVLGVAETLAAAGFAAIAIDLPLHGVNDTTGQLNGPNIFVGYDEDDEVRERTFGLDLLTEPMGGTPTPGPDGVVDSSGLHFINVQNLAVTRDNVKQAVSDFVNLRVALASLALPAMSGGDVFDETQVHFLGHSLGGIIGTPFAALQPDLVTTTLGMASGGLPYTLAGSTVLGPAIEAALDAAGIEPGSRDFRRFLATAQAVSDSSDPINFADALGSSGRPIYGIEIVGGGPLGGMPDLVIPNSVPGAPLAGTEALFTRLGLDSITATTNDPAGIQGAVRFVEGEHSSLVTPGVGTSSAAAFAEIQQQLSSFAGSDGADIVVTNSNVIQQ